MDLVTLKILLLFLILLMTAVFGFLPLGLLIYLADPKDSVGGGKTRRWLSRLGCFAGGVFLGTTLLHLQPEVHETMEYVLKSKSIDTKFPVAEFVIGVGFFLVIFLDTLVMKLKYSRRGYNLLNNVHTVEKDDVPLQRHYHDNVPAEVSSFRYKKNMSRSKSWESFKSEREDQLETSFALNKSKTHEDEGGERNSPGSCQIEFVNGGSSRTQAEESHPLANSITTRQIDTQQKLRSLLLLIAISFHSIFGGLALGLSQSKLALWTLFIAISVHKSVVVFTIGLQLFQTQSVKLAAASVIIFTFISPIGGAIGTIISETESQDEITMAVVSSVLQGLATGTFLYVTFFEILQKELRQGHSITKIFCILIGFSCMAGLSYLEGA